MTGTGSTAMQGVDPGLIGGVIGAVLSIIITGGIVALVFFCVSRRYHRTAMMPSKKIDQ